jgi:hypothetical protein
MPDQIQLHHQRLVLEQGLAAGIGRNAAKPVNNPKRQLSGSGATTGPLWYPG